MIRCRGVSILDLKRRDKTIKKGFPFQLISLDGSCFCSWVFFPAEELQNIPDHLDDDFLHGTSEGFV